MNIGTPRPPLGAATLKHVPALDGIRAIAVLIVMLSHAGLGKVIPGGFGVTIFFFLSGYLIISLMRCEQANNGKVSLSEFYLRRTIRIFPPLYITIAAACIAGATGWLVEPIDPLGVLRDVTFLTNYGNLWSTGPGVPIPLWSIDVEEHFYILFSLAFAFWLHKLRNGQAAAICAMACVIILLVRIWIVSTSTDFAQVYYWSHTRIDSILFGGCLALWNNPQLDGKNAWRPRWWHIGIAAGVLGACVVVRSPAFRDTLRYTLQGIGLFVVFSAVLHDRGWVSRVLGSLPFRWIGILSYTLYLVHFPLVKIIEANAGYLPIASKAVLMLLGSTTYALAMHFVVERPLARWRSRRASKRRSSPDHHGGNDPVPSRAIN